MNLEFLAATELFSGISQDEIPEMLTCIRCREKEDKKDETVFRAGDKVSDICLVEQGSVNIVVNFYWGSSNIFGHYEKGEIFSETYAALPEKELFCDVVAAEECKILFMDMNSLLTRCADGCDKHNRLIRNLVSISARKNFDLSARMMHIASRSIRNRLISYFTTMSIEQGNNEFTIPFSRQQLADYLSVDRSALSNELSKMQKDGIITYKKNRFRLNEDAVNQ